MILLSLRMDFNPVHACWRLAGEVRNQGKLYLASLINDAKRRSRYSIINVVISLIHYFSLVGKIDRIAPKTNFKAANKCRFF